MAKRDDPRGPDEAMPQATRAAVQTILVPGELITQVVTAVGCSLVLSERQLILVRQGLNYRPRSGVQSWPLDRTLTVRTTAVRHGTGRIIIERSGRTTSVFVSADEWSAAEGLLMELHRRVHGSA